MPIPEAYDCDCCHKLTWQSCLSLLARGHRLALCEWCNYVARKVCNRTEDTQTLSEVTAVAYGYEHGLVTANRALATIVDIVSGNK